MKWLLLPVIFALVLGMFLYVAHADPGFHRITETLIDREETYLEVIGEIEIDVLDEEGKPTGKKIKRPVTEKKTRKWKEKKITQGGLGITFIDFGIGNILFFLGRDIDGLIANGHLDVARNYTDVTYLDSGVTPMRVPFRQWVTIGKPIPTGYYPRYHYGGTPTIEITVGEFNQLTDP